MNSFRLLAGLAGCALLLASSSAFGLSRTAWEMHNGLEVTASNPNGLIAFTCVPNRHGAVCEYDVATIPPEGPGWGPAPNGEIIDFHIGSRVCAAPGGQTCLVYGDFTYFQTFVDIPADTVLTTFTIAFSGMDDGSRVSIFNSAYPAGLVIPGSYVFLGGSGTTNLADYVVVGEINRVVITQVDDCCSQNNLRVAQVVLNGDVITTDPDNCPGDPDKMEPGVCGCGVPDVDTDSDGALDCQEECPLDPDKLEAGACGCNVEDTDTDGDTVADCDDACPLDADNDGDGDGVCGDVDNCDTFNPDQGDADGDGQGDVCDVCPLDPEDDADADGVCGDVDLCVDTALPESVPTARLGTNRWADVDGDGIFDTSAPKGRGPGRDYTIDDTAGCSCAQIIAATGVGQGHVKFGCSISTMDCWTECVGDADVAACFDACKQ